MTDTGKTFSGRHSSGRLRKKLAVTGRHWPTQGRHSVTDTGKTCSDRHREDIQWKTGRHSAADTGKTFSGRHREDMTQEDIQWQTQGRHDTGRHSVADTGKT